MSRATTMPAGATKSVNAGKCNHQALLILWSPW